MEAGIFPTKRSAAHLPKSPRSTTKRTPEKPSPIDSTVTELIKAARKSLQNLKEFLGTSPASNISPQYAKTEQKKQKKSIKRKSAVEHPFSSKECLFVFPLDDEPEKENQDQNAVKSAEKGKVAESSCKKKLDFNQNK